MAAEWVGEYTLPASSQKTTFTSGNNTFRAEPGSIWALAAWNLILFDSASYSPGIRGSEIGLRSALKSLSPECFSGRLEIPSAIINLLNTLFRKFFGKNPGK